MTAQSKKGADIALNIVIFAAIGLLVLVIIVFILGQKSGQFSKGVSSCESLGGECSNDPCLLKGKPEIPNGDCPVSEGSPKKYCCSAAFGQK